MCVCIINSEESLQHPCKDAAYHALSDARFQAANRVFVPFVKMAQRLEPW